MTLVIDHAFRQGVAFTRNGTAGYARIHEVERALRGDMLRKRGVTLIDGRHWLDEADLRALLAAMNDAPRQAVHTHSEDSEAARFANENGPVSRYPDDVTPGQLRWEAGE